MSDPHRRRGTPGADAAVPDPRLALNFYYRVGCHLCEAMAEELRPLLAELDLRLHERDVDADPQWRLRYGLEVPVLEAGGEVICRYFLDPQRLRAWRARLAGRGGRV